MNNRTLSSHFDQKLLNDGSILLSLSKEAKKEFETAQWIDFPKVGALIDAFDPLLSIESTKAIFELESPIAGKIMEVQISSVHLLDSTIRLEPVYS